MQIIKLFCIPILIHLKLIVAIAPTPRPPGVNPTFSNWPVLKISQERKHPCPPNPNDPPECTEENVDSNLQSDFQDLPFDDTSFGGGLDFLFSPDSSSKCVQPQCYEPINVMTWDNRTIKNGTISSQMARGQTVGILAQLGDRIIVTCSASFVTRWVTNILLTETTKYVESKRWDQTPFDAKEMERISENEYHLVVSVSNYGDDASGAVRCESAENSSLAVEIYIFAQNGADLVGQGSTQKIEYTNSTLLVPCTANYHWINATLYEGEGTEVSGFIYHKVASNRLKGLYNPMVGFHVQPTGKLRETYKCLVEGGNGEVLYVFNKVILTENETTWMTTGETQVQGQLANEDEGDEEVETLDVFCHSKHLAKTIKMIHCKSVYECDWIKTCFEECWSTTDVEIKPLRGSALTVRLGNPYPRGIVSCYNQPEGLQFYNYYFLGIDRQSYFLSGSTIQPTALIKIVILSQSPYTDKVAKYQCEISTFLLVSNIRFFVLFKNGTQILVDRVDPINGDPDIVEYEDRGFSRKGLDLNLTTDMSTIGCSAPWRNSTGWIYSTIALNVKDVTSPEIVRRDVHTRRVFYTGENNRHLHCISTGEPKPTIMWTVPNPDILQMVRISENNEEESTLSFQYINMSLRGTYTCIASNGYGNDSLQFYVDILTKTDGLTDGAIGGIAVACVGFIILILILIYVGFKYLEAKDHIRDLTEEEITEFIEGNPEALQSDQGQLNIQHMAFDPLYIIPETELIIAKNAILGEGEYGMVFRGFLKDQAVAVKTTKPNPDVAYFKALLGEVKIMACIGKHDNVVTFLGAVTERIRERIVYAVVELCPHGNLHSHLRKVSAGFCSVSIDGSVPNKSSRYGNIEVTVTTLNLVHWCEQIASGMAHLAEKRVIHGDLATRNVLVFNNNVVKITDFGLSRQLYGYSNYVKKHQAPLPWRWLAIEALRFMEFSTKSDVWSFGVTCWEIFSFAESPFPGYNWTMDFVDKLANGLRLNRPQNAPQIIYDQLCKCWMAEPESRPSFVELTHFFHQLMTNKESKLMDVDTKVASNPRRDGGYANDPTTIKTKIPEKNKVVAPPELYENNSMVSVKVAIPGRSKDVTMSTQPEYANQNEENRPGEIGRQESSSQQANINTQNDSKTRSEYENQG